MSKRYEHFHLFEALSRHLFSISEADLFRNELLILIQQQFSTDYVGLVACGQQGTEVFVHPPAQQSVSVAGLRELSFEALLVLTHEEAWPASLQILKQAGLSRLVLMRQSPEMFMLLGWKEEAAEALPSMPQLQRLHGRLYELLSLYKLLVQQQQHQPPKHPDFSEGQALENLLIHTFPGLFLVVNKAGNILRWSDKTETLLGLNAATLSEKKLLALFPPDRQALVRTICQEAYSGGYATMENELLMVGGLRRSFAISLRVYQGSNLAALKAAHPALSADAEESEPLLLVAGIDISHRKQLEASLRKISNHLRHLINNDILSYIKWNKDFEVLDWSAKSAAIFGWSAAEVKGKHILDFKFLHPEEHERVKGFLKKFKTGRRESAKHELKHLTKSGKAISIEWYTTAIKDEEGNITAFLSLGNETTERNQIEQDLLQTNQKLEAVLNSSPVSIVTFNLLGQVQGWNKAAEQIFGYKAEEVTGREPLYVPPDERQNFRELVSALAGENAQQERQLQAKRKNNSRLLLRENIGAIRDKEGRVRGLIAIQEDVTEQERLKQRLREEKVYREAILQNLQNLIIACDATGTINLFNRAARNRLQTDSVGMPYQSWEELFQLYEPDGSKKLALEEMPLYRALHEEKVNDQELMMQMGDGSRRTFSCNASAIFDYRGHKIGALLSMEDITEKRESLQEFFNEKEFSDAILSSLPGIFYVLDGAGRFIRWNKRLLSESGYSHAEVGNLLATDLIASEDRQKVQEAIGRVFKAGESRVEALFLTKGGCKIPYLFTGHSFTKNGNMYVVGMGLDIAEKKAAEQSLERLASILEATTDVVGIFNEEKECLYLNAKGLKFYAVNKPEEQTLYDCCPSWMRDEIDSHIITEADEKGMWRGKGALLNSQAEEVPVSLVLISHQTKEGKYYSAIARDISAQIEYQQKLKDQNEELKKINAELDRFVYSASHDLRAPLVSILGLINIARLSLNGSELPQYLDLMESRIGRLDVFIQDIEDFSRNSRLGVKKELIDFDLLIEESRENLKFTKGAERVSLLKEIKVNEPFYSDKSRLMIVMNNLISNAIRYSNPERTDSFIKIKVETDRQQVVLQVEDNGLGIAKQYQEKIFEMFFRASATNVGSGLGLFIVKETLEKLGGSISVRSRLGEFTVFTINLPNLKP